MIRNTTVRHFVIVCLTAHPHLKPLTIKEVIPLAHANPRPRPTDKRYEVLREEKFTNTSTVAHLMHQRGDLIVKGRDEQFRILPKKFPNKVIHKTGNPAKREVHVSFAL